MLVAGHAGIPERAKEDRVDIVAQMAKRGVGQRLFRLEIVIGGKRQAFPRKTEVVSCSYLVENRDRGFDHLGPDTVAGNYRDAVLHSNPVGRPHDRQ